MEAFRDKHSGIETLFSDDSAEVLLEARETERLATQTWENICPNDMKFCSSHCVCIMVSVFFWLCSATSKRNIFTRDECVLHSTPLAFYSLVFSLQVKNQRQTQSINVRPWNMKHSKTPSSDKESNHSKLNVTAKQCENLWSICMKARAVHRFQVYVRQVVGKRNTSEVWTVQSQS